MRVEKRVALQTGLIKHMLEDNDTDGEDIPLLQYDEKTLQRVFDFTKHELDIEKLPEIPRPVPTERLADCVPVWFANFMSLNSLEEVYDIISAANYLEIPSLTELGCAKVGCLMKNKTIPELRKMFNIENDFTPEEERTILEGRADIWGDEDDEGDEGDQAVGIPGQSFKGQSQTPHKFEENKKTL